MAIKVPTAEITTQQQRGLPGVWQENPQKKRSAADFINTNQVAAIESVGNALNNITKTALSLHTKEVADNNQSRIKEAENRIATYDQDAAYGNDNQPGWLNQTGKAVFKQENGKLLFDNVLEDRQKKIDEIKQDLSNDDQLQAFSEYVNKTGIRLRGHLRQHQIEQNKIYQQGVLGLSIDTQKREMALHYNDESTFEDSISRIMQDSTSLGRLKDGSEEIGIVSGRKHISEAVKQSIQSALQHSDYSTATRIQERYGEHLDPDDRNGIQNKISEHWAADMLEKNPEEMTNLLSADSLKNAILKQESNGRDFDEQGNPLVSSDGKSMFAMQVTHETAANPGFGITPAKAQSPAEYNRVGSELLDKLRNRYQDDPAKVAAAYNAGAGNVDDAIAKGGPDWMQYIPEKTRETYVPIS